MAGKFPNSGAAISSALKTQRRNPNRKGSGSSKITNVSSIPNWQNTIPLSFPGWYCTQQVELVKWIAAVTKKEQLKTVAMATKNRLNLQSSV